MQLRDLGEFGFIDRIAQMAGGDARVVAGIGDDAALLDVGWDYLVVVTTDAMIEGHHFHLDWLSPAEVGWRACAAGLSDLAAMGAAPLAVFCSVGIPSSWPVEQAETLMTGVAEAAQTAGAVLAGGDTVASERAMVDIAAVGVVLKGRELLRSGAQPGQVLAVTGSLGGSAAAVAALRGLGPEALGGEAMFEVRGRYAHPQPRVAAGQALAASGLVAAAIDVSDGLVQDAGHIAERSGVRAVIEAGRVPITVGCERLAQVLAEDPRQWALTGGEDFELLIALDEANLPALLELDAVADVGLTVVGRIEVGEGVVAVDETGRELDLPRGGWDHFGAPPE